MNEEFEKNIDILNDFIADKNDSEISATELAKILKNIKKNDEELFFQYLEKMPSDILGEIVLELPDRFLKEIIENVPKNSLKEAIEELESDDATDLIQDIEDVDSEQAKEILSFLDKEDQEEIKKLKRYDDEQAGAYMQTELFMATYDERIQDALERLKQEKREGILENIHHTFIIDTLGRLMFTITLEDLILFDFNKTFREELKDKEDEFQPKYVQDTDEIDEIVHIVENYDLTSLPVVDSNHKLLGRITSDDIHDLVQERATEQIYGLAGVDDEAEHEENITEAGKSRASWLFVNLLTAILASIVIGLFDKTLQSYVALAVLMPIVASMGGNAGTQTLTIMVRQLALGEVDFQNAKEALWKELILSCVNGLLFGIIMGLIAFFWFKDWRLGLIIASSMQINLLLAGLVGAGIPLLLKRVGIDPAIGSTVILTTFTDVVGFFSFLGLASLFLLK
ncbi:magnesium transporter [Sulfurospirillum sp. 1612]|uniref:magnesium transporter n=1 Tax=Sulfurospirillum sp. 1612 TaxID=3094835 RepID=UPI002F92F46F